MTLQNLAGAAAIVSAAYVWRRSGFWIPGWIPIPLRARGQLLVAAGCLVLVVFLGQAAGEIIGGKAEVSPTHPRYASRVTEPRRFWGKVLPNIAGALALGGALIAFGRGIPAATGRARLARVDHDDAT